MLYSSLLYNYSSQIYIIYKITYLRDETGLIIGVEVNVNCLVVFVVEPLVPGSNTFECFFKCLAKFDVLPQYFML